MLKSWFIWLIIASTDTSLGVLPSVAISIEDCISCCERLVHSSSALTGLMILIDKITGNIIKVTDVFQNFNPKKRNKIFPTGFIVGTKNIYLSTNIGRLLVIDIKSGKTISTLKIDKGKISRPYVLNKNLYLVRDNAIIRLN